ncbi:MAG: RNA recognition motif domain-containing protein [Synechococcaceae cyanobacterium]|jgi:RNA recognition motif-containing protein
MTIFIGNLSFDAEAEDVRSLFAEYGDVRQCSMPLDRETGRKRGFAFVEMEDAQKEDAAINDLQNVEWMGRAIRVNKAEPRTGGGPRRSDRRPAGAFGGGGGYNGGGYGGGNRS